MRDTFLFLFGTLRHDGLRRIVAGRDVEGRPARLRAERCERALGGDWPVLVPGGGDTAEGLLVDADAGLLARFDFYEAVFGYRRDAVEVVLAEGTRMRADLWRPDHDDPGAGVAWDLAEWSARWSEVTCNAAEDIMRRFGQQDIAEVARLAPIIRARAEASLRTRDWHRPRRVGAPFGPGDVTVLERAHPYDGFFSVEEVDVRHRRFDGGEQTVRKRGVFRASDATTVLPYDPVRDRVLFVEQIRFGPLAQGDPVPWLLEPVAGLVDFGETPEAAGRREAAEEAGIAVGDLHFIARYYPSPGGVAQILYSYVGIADLPDGVATIGGHMDEQEDILSHVLGFDAAFALIGSGDLVNAPAIISMQWLAAHRDRLRAAAKSG